MQCVRQDAVTSFATKSNNAHTQGTLKAMQSPSIGGSLGIPRIVYTPLECSDDDIEEEDYRITAKYLQD